MEEIGIVLIIFGTVTAFITTALYLFLIWRMERYIETTYPELWTELGKPHLIRNNSLTNGRKVLTFLKKGEYSKFDDSVFTKKGLVVKLLLYSTAMLWLVAFIGAIFVSAQSLMA